MSNQAIFLTQEGYQKLQEELRFMQNEKRFEIAEKLKEAISFGDLSENSEYEEARNEQAQVEHRIGEIEDQLKRVEIIKEESDTKKWVKKISMGMTISIQEVWSQNIESYKIVGTTEANILTEIPRISNESPLGKEILWKKKWDIFELKNKAGEWIKYTITHFE